jgi:hypothetical protein
MGPIQFTRTYIEIEKFEGSLLMGYLHNLTDISEHCFVRHLKVSYNKK